MNEVGIGPFSDTLVAVSTLGPPTISPHAPTLASNQPPGAPPTAGIGFLNLAWEAGGRATVPGATDAPLTGYILKCYLSLANLDVGEYGEGGDDDGDGGKKKKGKGKKGGAKGGAKGGVLKQSSKRVGARTQDMTPNTKQRHKDKRAAMKQAIIDKHGADNYERIKQKYGRKGGKLLGDAGGDGDDSGEGLVREPFQTVQLGDTRGVKVQGLNPGTMYVGAGDLERDDVPVCTIRNYTFHIFATNNLTLITGHLHTDLHVNVPGTSSN